MSDNEERIESIEEVRAYIQKLNYALDSGAQITLQKDRRVDRERNYMFTNRYTIADLFPDEDPANALRRELRALKVEDYRRTVVDTTYTTRPEFREFGKTYDGKDVYIKIRVELVTSVGGKSVFVMSFHYAEYEFKNGSFPYRENEGGCL